MAPIRWAAELLALHVAGTFAFDVIHGLLHRWERARSPTLRALARWHQVHHRFLGPDLRLRRALARQNLLWHRLPEWATEILVTSLGFALFDPRPVVLLLTGQTAAFLWTTLQGGEDVNHRPLTRIPAPRRGPLVGPAYHALHHRWPDRYQASFTKLFDWLLGTGCRLRGRRIALTGASGAFGAPLAALLEREGAEVDRLHFGRDWGYGDTERIRERLRAAEILVLCHGAKGARAMEANCDSFAELAERFLALHRGELTPPELWAVGSEIEAHPAFGDPELQRYSRSKRAWARLARRYHRDPRLIYRHIVPSAFRSRMGPGLISGETAARMALFFVRRGCQFVPVTYTGIALIAWVKLAFGPLPAAAPPPSGASYGAAGAARESASTSPALNSRST
ncbi:MAG: hypothetical protein ACYCWW_04775, partial [Deltaproteobacteria bacterium]